MAHGSKGLWLLASLLWSWSEAEHHVTVVCGRGGSSWRTGGESERLWGRLPLSPDFAPSRSLDYWWCFHIQRRSAVTKKKANSLPKSFKEDKQEEN